jgi:hypothetical protein
MSKEWENVEVWPLEDGFGCGGVHGIQHRILKVVHILALVLAVRCLNGVALTTEIEIW